MDLLQQLNEVGVNTETALQRFSGNEGLYRRFLLKFLQDENFQIIQDAYKSGDYTGTLEAAHTLKGVSGNLGMDALYTACSHLVEAIRRENKEQYDTYYQDILESYKPIREVLKKFVTENPQ